MPICYVTGRAGSGKTTYILQQAVSCAKNGDKVLVLTPELMTFAMEQALTRELPVLWNVEVLSPSRLLARVRAEESAVQPPLLDDAGRAMALRAAVSGLKGRLSYFKTMSAGLLEKLVVLLEEIKDGELGATGLRLAADRLPQGGMRDKLYDLAAILDGYEAFLAGKYLDGADAVDRFCTQTGSSAFLKDSVVFVDGFDVLPLKTCRLVLALCLACKEVTISFKTDSRFGRDEALFSPVQQSYECLHRMVLENGIPWQKKAMEGGQIRSAGLAHLERELFARPMAPYMGKVQDIEIVALHDAELEAERAAGAVARLIRENGFHPEETAVVCAQPEEYAAALARAFMRRGIPLFADVSFCCAFHPAARYLLSALEAVRRGYRQEDMIRCLKSGFAPLTKTQQDETEIYILENALRGNGFLRPCGSKRQQMALNSFMTPLEYLRAEGFARKQSVREFCRLCYGFMEKSGLRSRLNRSIRRYENQSDAYLAGRCAQVWDETIRLLDQAVEICGDERLDPGEFIRFLRTGLENIELMGLPQKKSAVYFGSVRRFKPAGRLRALIVLGANDGVLPEDAREDSLLDDKERRLLRAVKDEYGLVIRDVESEMELSRFLIYTALAAPSDRLIVSYSMASLGGKALQPSSLIKRLRLLFPGLALEGGLETDDTLWYASRLTAKQQLEDGLRRSLSAGQADESVRTLYAAMAAHAPEGLKEAVRAIQTPESEQSLTPGLAGRLYGKNRTSISRLESFASCPYRHFVEYGLRPRQLREKPVDSRDIGTAYHDAIENFVRAVSHSGIGFDRITDEQSDTLMEAAALKSMEAFRGRGALEGGRGRQTARQMLSTLRRAGRTLVFQLRHSRFLPVAEEQAFGFEKGDLTLTLDGGETVSVHGRIDRVDLYVREDGQKYVRVVDYKSGNALLDLSGAYYGVRLQLFVYMDAVLNMEEAKPAGVFYFKIGDPTVEKEKLSGRSALEEVEKQLSLKGLVLNDMQLIQSMCRPEELSRILPISLTKEGAISKNQQMNALSEGDFDTLRRYTRLKLKRLYEEILMGRIEARPLSRGGEAVPCAYCPYKGVCGMESSWLKTTEMTVQKREALDKMEQEIKEEEHA